MIKARKTRYRTPIVALLGLAALAAMAFALSACGDGGQATASAGASGGSKAASAVETVSLTIKTDEEHGKKGSDGNWHDAYLPADFSVKPGATVKVTVTNYDEMSHSFTAPDLGTNATIAGGGENKPSKTTFTFTAPKKPGKYDWFCAAPCDPWAMSHDGFMKGYVTVA